jgi:hypothetical protein
MKRLSFSIGLAACALAVAVALPATAGAAFHHQHSRFGSHATGTWTPPAAAGKVATVTPPSGTSLGSFTVSDARTSTTTTVDVTGTTTYAAWGVTTPGFSNIATGDYVIVVGTTADSVVTATNIIIMVPRTKPTPPTPPAAIGKVTTVTPPSGTSLGSFTITGLKGTVWTITVGTGTTYTENGVTTPPPSFASLATNDFVSVQGTVTGTTVAATSIRIFDPSLSTNGWGIGRHRHGPPSKGTGTAPAASGKVGTVTPPAGTSLGSFTVTDARTSTTITVDVTGTTTYKEWGVTTPGFGALASGDFVVVMGTTAGTTVTATSIIIMVPRTTPITPVLPMIPSAIGKVTTVTPPSGTSLGSFTITGFKGTVWTITVGPGTTYTEWGVTTPPPSFSSLTTSDFVSVVGTVTGTTVAATSVRIFDPSLPIIGGPVKPIISFPTAPIIGGGSHTGP